MAQADRATGIDPRLLRRMLAQRPELRPAFRRACRTVRIARLGVSVDLSKRCNLFCEGYLFFEGGHYRTMREAQDLARWDALFARLASEGVRHVYLAGAEPALERARLRATVRHIPHGVIFTNGTLPIPDNIPYRLNLSLWGDPELSATLRGGDSAPSTQTRSSARWV